MGRFPSIPSLFSPDWGGRLVRRQLRRKSVPQLVANKVSVDTFQFVHTRFYLAQRFILQTPHVVGLFRLNYRVSPPLPIAYVIWLHFHPQRKNGELYRDIGARDFAEVWCRSFKKHTRKCVCVVAVDLYRVIAMTRYLSFPHPPSSPPPSSSSSSYSLPPSYPHPSRRLRCQLHR